MGAADPGADLLPRSAVAHLSATGSGRRNLAWPRQRGMALYRAPDCGGRHDGGNLLYGFPHAQETAGRFGEGILRTAWGTSRAGIAWTHRALYELQNGIRPDRR